MQFSLIMPCFAYKKRIDSLANKPLTLKALLTPFGIHSDRELYEGGILTGIFLDALDEEFDRYDQVDLVDVMILAESLGFEPAQAFLDSMLITIKSPQVLD